MKATIPGGSPLEIPDCAIEIPSTEVPSVMIKLRILPEITDSKSASYQDAPVIGRAFPIKTYSHSENRTITMKLHFVIVTAQDADDNMLYLRAIQSAVYPRDKANGPYTPPPICKIKCGRLLSADWLCVVLKQYSVSFDTNVAWYSDNFSYLPYKLDVDTTWDVVFPSEDLPGAEKIIKDL